jgi:G3E family GTPase
VTLVDALTSELAIDSHFEASKQVAFAHRVLITKTDMASDASAREKITGLKKRLEAMARSAEVHLACEANQPVDPAVLFHARKYLPEALGDDVVGWLALDHAIRAEEAGHADQTAGRHGGRINTFTLTREGPVERIGFRKLMDMMAQAAGPRLLRAKGLVSLVADRERPFIVHAVQHIVQALLREPRGGRQRVLWMRRANGPQQRQ